MHELSISLKAIELVMDQAQKHQVKQITGITLSVGVLSCIELEALRVGLELASRDTIAEGALITIETVGATAWCQECEQSVSVKVHHDACPRCRGHHLLLETGEELKVKHIEVA
ncbi:hydrogenase maturation nickel metallochaperone HypA [Vibrio mediterranei]